MGLHSMTSRNVLMGSNFKPIDLACEILEQSTPGFERD